VLEVPWPPALAERLTGRASVSVHSASTVIAEAIVRFDSSDEEFALVEPGTGIPQVVNKWGRVARSFEGREATLLDEVFDEVERLTALVADRARLDLFVTGGTLLGPVRDGRMLPSDDDADLAYLSRHTNPSDVALEGFALERMLVANGYEVVRHSSGHLQLHFPGGTVTDRFYIDVFTYFRCNGFLYGAFHVRQPEHRVPILPLTPLRVHGRMLAGPADPPRLLEAIYGPGWAEPDPAFAFETPPAAARRFFWWLNHFDVDRENWEDRHRAEQQSGPRPGPSELALRAAGTLPAGSSVVDLGCGLGADALHLAATGHRVVGADYSRPALAYARVQSSLPEARLRYERVNLNATRQVLQLRKLLAGLDGPVHVVARQLFDALPPLGWDTTLLFMHHLLADGGTAFLEVETDRPARHEAWTDYAHVDLDRLSGQLDRYRLRIEDLDPAHPDATGSTVARMTVKRIPR
jgi:SAM-dependent methyltransferase